jgi:hypothetical protein
VLLKGLKSQFSHGCHVLLGSGFGEDQRAGRADLEDIRNGCDSIGNGSNLRELVDVFVGGCDNTRGLTKHLRWRKIDGSHDEKECVRVEASCEVGNVRTRTVISKIKACQDAKPLALSQHVDVI